MARDNGGIIGPANNPTSDSASGVWDLPAQYQAISGGNWPPIPTIAANSLRFNDGSTDYLSRTPASASNRKTWTFSAWVKLASSFTSDRIIFGAGNDGDNQTFINFQDTQGILFSYELANVRYLINTSAVFRDVSAWYHIVLAVDTTQATDTNRVKLYINGVQQTFNTVLNGFPPQNADTFVNNTSVHNVGYGSWNSFNPYDGYMSEVILVDGQQLEPTSFGQFNANGIWTPIPIGLSFGTNGFQLKFENSASLGLDSSPNGNNWTVNNLTSIDQVTDTPTNNFATWNATDKNSTVTLSEGNTTISATEPEQCRATLGASSGKWYWEYRINYTVEPLKPHAIGVCTNTGFPATQNSPDWRTTEPFNSAWNNDTSANNIDTYVNGTRVSRLASNLSYPDNGDIINVALDLDNGKIFFGKNGTYIQDGSGNTGNPSTGANPVYSFAVNDYFYFPAIVKRGSPDVPSIQANFGNPPFTIASGNSDANGYGNFEYAPPSGHYALCTKNLAEFG